MDAVLPLAACAALAVVLGVVVRLAHRRKKDAPLHVGAGTTVAMRAFWGGERLVVSLLRGGAIAVAVAAAFIVVQWLMARTPAEVFFGSRDFQRSVGVYLVGAAALALVLAGLQFRAFGAPDRAIDARLAAAAGALGLRLERNANASAANWITAHADGAATHLWAGMIDRWWSLTAPDQPSKLLVVNHTPRSMPAANQPGSPDIHESVGLSLFWLGAPSDDRLGRGFEDEVRALGFEPRRWKAGLVVSVVRPCDGRRAAETIAEVVDPDRIAALWRLCDGRA